jgi:HKD family nuclease
MSKNFFLQGFTERTYLEEVILMLQTPHLQRVLISVAFVNEEGVKLLEGHLPQQPSKAVFFCGIRNDITSYQGIARLLSLGHSVYLIDTGSRGRIFHPKIYMARGSSLARIIVGSGNLTLGGLNNNVEAGLGLELSLGAQDDKTFILAIEKQFDDLPSAYPENIIHVTNLAELNILRESGRLLDEEETSTPRPTKTYPSVTSDTVPKINLPVNIKYRTIKRTRKKTSKKESPQGKSLVPISPAQISSISSTNLALVWQSKPLGERNLNIPRGENTHATGSLGLDKGLLDPGIDHRHYFRDEVFSALKWERAPGRMSERATATFQLVIKNQFQGEFETTIRHSADTSSASYIQRNTMTYLSWGSMKNIISKPDYIGRTLSLYSDETDSKKFVLEID